MHRKSRNLQQKIIIYVFKAWLINRQTKKIIYWILIEAGNLSSRENYISPIALRTDIVNYRVATLHNNTYVSLNRLDPQIPETKTSSPGI